MAHLLYHARDDAGVALQPLHHLLHGGHLVSYSKSAAVMEQLLPDMPWGSLMSAAEAALVLR